MASDTLPSDRSLPPSGIPVLGRRRYGRPGILLLAVAATLLTLLLAAGTILASERYDHERRAIFAESLREATSVAARVELFFEGRLENLETIALTPLVRDGEPTEIKAWFEELVAAGSAFSGGLSLIGTDGVMILLSGFPLDDPPIDLSDRDYVRAVLGTGRATFGDAIIGRRSGDPLLTFAVPVPDDGGATMAVLAGTIRIDLPVGGFVTLGESLSGAVILDGSGQVVLDRGIVAEPMPAADVFLAAVASGSGVRDDVSGPDGTGSWLAGWAPVGETGWRAVVLEDPEARLAPAWRALLLTLGAVALLAVLGALLSLWGARRLDAAAAREGRAAEELRQREIFLHRFADALPVIAGTLDAERRTTFANAALREGHDGGLLGLVHPDDVAALPSATTAAPERTVEVRLRDSKSPDGYRWHRIGFVEAESMPGTRWFFAAADIDDAKREELGLRRDIQQRDEFLGLVSHELRTPLTVIRGNALLLSKRDGAGLPADVADGLAEIEAGSRQLQRLLENMLVLSRQSSVAPGSGTEPQIPAVLVNRIVSDFRVTDPDVEILLEIEQDLPIVAANDTFVDQVIWNLLTNAQRYGGPGQTITLSVKAQPPGVEVAVLDQGPGIAASDLEHVFEPHFRGEATRASASGLGLGLTVCRRLVEWQGGTMSVSTNPSGGMRFAFTLPRIDELEEPSSVTAAPGRPRWHDGHGQTHGEEALGTS